MSIEIKVNLDNAQNSLAIMHTYFSDKNIEGQAQVPIPASIMPFSAAHYRYLFYSCLLNYGVKSSVLHQNMLAFYETHPNLFLPNCVIQKYSNNYSELADLLRTHIHVRYPNECAKRWVGLSEILHTKYDDNPQKMFVKRTTYSELKDAISQIKGLGQKTGGLLLRMLIDTNMIQSVDGITEIPIDRHDVDICIWLEVITKINADEIKKSKKTIKMLSDVWVQAANNLSISPSLADQYLWIIGSQFCVSSNCSICPIRSQCKRKEKS